MRMSIYVNCCWNRVYIHIGQECYLISVNYNLRIILMAIHCVPVVYDNLVIIKLVMANKIKTPKVTQLN